MLRTSKIFRTKLFARKPRPEFDVLVSCVCDEWSTRESTHAAAEEALRQHVEYDCPVHSSRLTARHYANFKTVARHDASPCDAT
jgi:hypothetical protein